MSDKKIVDNDVLFGLVCKALDEGHETIIPVKGVSMLPLICEQDTVLLEGIDKDFTNIKKYRIALAKIGNNYILHRILNIDGDTITLQGDGNIYGTELCGRQDICGVAVSIKKNGNKDLNPNSRLSILKFKTWLFLRPVRRYLLYIYRKWKSVFGVI